MRWSVFVLVILLLTACSSSPSRQPIDLNINLPTKWTVDSGQSGAVQNDWWTSFNDQGLNSAIAKALKYNYDLKIAAANVKAAVSEAKNTGADIYPMLNLGVSGTRSRQNYIGLPIGGLGEEVLSSTSNRFGASLDVSWEADLWGRISAGKKSALANLKATQAEFAGARLSLIAQTAKVWFTAIEACRQLEITKTMLNSHKKTLDWTRKRYQKGLSSSMDLREATSKTAIAQNTVYQRQEQYENIIRQLEIIMGDYPAGKLALTEKLCILSDEVPAGLPADLISRRPDLVAVEYRLISTKALVDQAKANLYPSFSLTGSGGTTSSELKDLLDGDFKVWSIMGNLIQPLFCGGKLRAGIDLAKSKHEQILATYANTVLKAYAEVEAALLAEEYLAQQEKQIALVYEQTQALYKIALKSYQSGLADSLTLLQSERSALEAESKLTTLHRRQLEARINLYLALGGGFNKTMVQSK